MEYIAEKIIVGLVEEAYDQRIRYQYEQQRYQDARDQIAELTEKVDSLVADLKEEQAEVQATKGLLNLRQRLEGPTLPQGLDMVTYSVEFWCPYCRKQFTAKGDGPDFDFSRVADHGCDGLGYIDDPDQE